MQRFLLIALIAYFSHDGYCQNLPTFRQFNLNPVLFNPAFNAIDNFTEISLIHRQQWLKFEDAPVASGLALQLAMYSRASIGFTVVTQESVALRNTLAKTIFAYKIPLGKEQLLSFGLTFGVGFNSLDLDGIDYSNDPAILNAVDSKAYADGSFGIAYIIKGLKVGFSLPRLFGQPYISPQQLDANEFSQLLNQLYSISYKFKAVRDVLFLEPYFIYRMNRDRQDSWEAASLLYLKEVVWTGVSYSNTQGVGFLLGFSIKSKLRFGYSFELPPNDENFISTSSHEFQLNYRIGEMKALVREPIHEHQRRGY